MKIIVSPSKTKVLAGVPTCSVWDGERTETLLAALQSMTVEGLGKALRLKPEPAQALFAFYQSYETAPVGAAGVSYTGLAFKNLDWAGLSPDGQAFAQEHLRILSAFYGILTPASPVKAYRLDLVDPIQRYGAESVGDLYAFWSEAVTAAFAEEDWILNLASKEYSRLVTHPRLVTVEFLQCKQGIWKQGSTASKMMRGQLAHYVCANGITRVEDLPHHIGMYQLDLTTEDPLTVTYREQA